MEPEKHRDIVKQMAERLREHTMPYKEGAWERFEEYKRKKSKRFVLWPYLSGAAAILIAVMVFLLKNHQPGLKPTQVVEATQQKEGLIVGEAPNVEIVAPKSLSNKSSQIAIATKENRKIASMKAESLSKTSIRARENEGVIEPLIEEKETKLAVQPMLVVADHTETIAKKEEVVKGEPATSTRPPVTESFAQHLDRMQDVEEKIQIKDIANKKWNVGLEVSPTFSNNQINVGGGVALAYSISPKLSISSGISYVQLDAQRGPAMGGPSRAMDVMSSPRVGPEIANLGRPADKKTLQTISSHLIGLDIPINLSYHVTPKMYVVAGVSLFNVLEENRVNEFKNELSEVAYASVSQKAPEPIIRTLYSTESVQEKPYERNSVAGFLNLSVGYTIPFSKVVGFSLAPFLKLPMRNFTDQDMNLTNGGIKVIASF